MRLAQPIKISPRQRANRAIFMLGYPQLMAGQVGAVSGEIGAIASRLLKDFEVSKSKLRFH